MDFILENKEEIFMRDIVIIGENQIISSFVQYPLWFAVGENNFHIWNCETQGLKSYHYHEIDVLGKKNSLSDSFQNPVNEIELLLPRSQKYTISLIPNEEQDFNHFYLSLLGQLAANI
jgi:hypothetical protein